MTSLLPPNLLRLFAPRDPVPYLRPLTKDDAERGPDRLAGVATLVTRLKDEADAEEIKKGLDDSVVTATETSSQAQAAKDKVESAGADGNGDVDMDTKAESVAEASSSSKKDKKEKARTETKPKRMDKIAKLGVVGQEARKMRAEERVKRQEKYKKDLEKNCTSAIICFEVHCRCPCYHACERREQADQNRQSSRGRASRW